MPQRLGGLLKDSRQEVRSQKMRIREAKEAVARAAEEKKALLAAAAAKKAKAAKKGGKKQEDAAAEEENKQDLKLTTQSDDGDLNLNDPDDFAKALSKEAPRPFTFGPIEFSDLNEETATRAFDGDKNKARVVDCLDLHMPQPNCCIRGHRVEIKGRNFKRASTMLKHGRWMQNLMVCPVFPKPLKVVQEDDENASEKDGSDGD